MRFAYIDSQGKEVTIPSVDALRLRIELGAIVDDTVFHDDNTGRWAPAGEHEIYRTLQRELSELEAGGFVVPPPKPPRREEPEPEPEPDAGPVPEPDLLGDWPAPPSRPPGDELPPPPGGFDLGFSVELAPEPAETEAGPEEAAAEAPGSAVEKAPPPAEAGSEGAPGRVPESVRAEVEKAAPGAGAVSGPVEGSPGEGPELPLSPEWGEDDAEGGDEEIPPAPIQAGEELPDWAAPPSQEDRVAAGLLDGVRLDPSTAESVDAEPPPPPPLTGMQLESPLSEYDADQPPEWMQKPSPSEWSTDPDRDARPGAAAVDRFEVVPEVDDFLPAPAPRRRGAPSPRKLTRAGTPGAGRVAAVGLVAVAVVAGVWFGSGYLARAMGGDELATAPPPLPGIARELEPVLQRVRVGAAEGLASRLGALPERGRIPAAPDREWLAGAYLAQPSRFPDVRTYWQAVSAYAAAARGAEDQAFRDALEEELGVASLPEEEAEQVRARAEAGWRAADVDRAMVYGQLEAVASSSLTLHDFLLANEGQISYEPAAGGVSRDPVLEAVPTSEALGVAMWDRVSAVTGALDDLGYLDTMETGGLLGAFLEKLASVAVR